MKYFYRYLPLSDEDQRQPLYLVAGGYTLIPPHTPYPPLPHPADHDFRWREGRTLQEYQLIFISRGSGRFESRSGGAHAIRAGHLIALFPGERHRYHPDAETGWDEYWAAFQGDAAAEVTAECGLAVQSPLADLGTNEPIIAEFLHIADELRAEAPGYQSIAAARVRVVLALARAATLRRGTGRPEITALMDRARCAMLEQSHGALNVEALAASLNVGYSWFRRAFRDYTGLPPAQYHLQLRLHRASELLRATSLPIAAISDELGFESAEYFSRIFKVKHGCSPREYRGRAQGQAAGRQGK